MRVPLSWLKEFAPVTCSAEDLAHALLSRGMEVERIDRPGSEVSGVVVGKVLEVRPHPNADKLHLVSLDLGSLGARSVVCGASNYVVDDLVPVALPGSTLPGGFEIARRKVRGEVSDGMMCSARELGLSEDHTGILILDPGFELGADLRECLGLGEPVLDLATHPNRPDLLSVRGVAREASLAFGIEFRDREPGLVESAGPVSESARVEVLDVTSCPRYLARVVGGITVGPSPLWMAQRLLSAGMRPINNVVDATNYVLLELGHPLHAFDLARLAERRVVVRRAHAGETMVTLDGIERALDTEDLVIADAAKAVAIAGIMGGGDAEVSESTTEVLLESAWFDPACVARTSRRLGLRTEASTRFERGADFEIVPLAAARAAQLMNELAGASTHRGAIDALDAGPARASVTFRPARARLHLGAEVSNSQMRGYLEGLGCEVEEAGGEWGVSAPSWRVDLCCEPDLEEEVARSYGYERIPSRLPPGVTGGLTREQILLRATRNLLVGSGLFEVDTLPFEGAGEPDMLLLDAADPRRSRVRVANPLADEEGFLRSAIEAGLLRTARYNLDRRNLEVGLFEVGRTFVADPGGGQPREACLVGILVSGSCPGTWMEPDRTRDFWDLKGILERLIRGLGISGARFEPADRRPYHPGRCLVVEMGGVELAVGGQIHPRAAAAYGVPEETFAASVDLDGLFASIPVRPEAPTVARFPGATVDLAFVVSDQVVAGRVEEAVRAALGGSLAQMRLFDVYRGEQVPAGHRSLAYGLIFQASDRTLSDEEVAALRRAAIEAAAGVGAALRA